jgi:hypothetical protein
MRALQALLLVIAAGFIAAPVPGDDLGSCTTSSLQVADASQHCKDRYRALCARASECDREFGAPCTEAAVTQACATAFWPADCDPVAERDALHCIELLQDLSCDELADPVQDTNVPFCEFCPARSE